MILALGWEDFEAERGETIAPADNISEPSVIRVPDWIESADRADPSAEYYMYFAAHHGGFIRLAWAEDIEGPWNLYDMEPDVAPEELGVLSVWGGEVIDVGQGVEIRPGECEPGRRKYRQHASGPFAMADDANQQILLYWGVGTCVWLDDELFGSMQLLAVSPDGLDFNDGIQPAAMGKAFMKLFRSGDEYWGISNQAKVLSPPDPQSPTGGYEDVPVGELVFARTVPPDMHACLFDDQPSPSDAPRVRHSDIHPMPGDDGETLWWFYSVKGYSEIDGEHQPEQIMFTELRRGANDCWGADWPGEVVLRAAPGWECGEMEVTSGVAGESGRFDRAVNNLRDPDFFIDDDGDMYVFYAGCGEKGIGMVRLELQERD